MRAGSVVVRSAGRGVTDGRTDAPGGSCCIAATTINSRGALVEDETLGDAHGERRLGEVALGAQHELVDEHVEQLLEVSGRVDAVYGRFLLLLLPTGLRAQLRAEELRGQRLQGQDGGGGGSGVRPQAAAAAGGAGRGRRWQGVPGTRTAGRLRAVAMSLMFMISVLMPLPRPSVLACKQRGSSRRDSRRDGADGADGARRRTAAAARGEHDTKQAMLTSSPRTHQQLGHLVAVAGVIAANDEAVSA